MPRAATKSKPPPPKETLSAVARSPFPPWLPALVLVLVTVLAYQPVWQAGFIWDDERHVTDNPQLVAPNGWKQIWSSRESLQYYPMVFSTFRLERALWGLSPAPYHWFNLLLHAGSALLLWRVLQRLGLPGAWLGAALFALHPVNVESVAWISQRKNTLAMLFYLLSLLLYLRSDQDSGPEPRISQSKARPPDQAPRTTYFCILHPPSSLLYWLSLLAFVLALLSKTAVAPLPLVLLGLAWWQRGRVTWRDVWNAAPFVAAALILGLITVWFERHVNASEIIRDDSFGSRLACAAWAIWFYLYKLLLPLNLVPIYPRWEVDAAKVWSWTPGVLLLAGLLLCWRFRQGWGKAALVCAGYYLLLLLPVLGFVNIGFMNVSLVADHWQYFAMIGPLALAAALIGSKFRAQGPGFNVHPWRLAACLLVVFLGVLTWQQSRLYADPEALWRVTLAGNPESWAAHNNLGSALVMKGQPHEALASYREAIRLKPVNADAYNNLGSALVILGRLDEAMIQFREALRLNAHSAAAHYNLGDALRTAGQPHEAIRLYQEALRLNPVDANIHNRLGDMLHRSGRVDEAMQHYREALRLNPGFAEARSNLGNALAQKGQLDAAIRCYYEALRLEPAFADAHNNLGNALADQGQTDAAIRSYQAALRLKPDLAAAHYNLGNALVRQAQTSDAVRHFQQALRLQPDHPQARRNLETALAVLAQATASTNR